MSNEGEPTATGQGPQPESAPVIELNTTANGRVSGKGWKLEKAATRRTQMSSGLKTPYEERMDKTQREKSLKKLQLEMKEEKEGEVKRRREITIARKKAALERQQFEEMKAKMSAKKAARLKRRAGRSKKVNG
ncbi:hypothetical protein M422DRAFT_251338 [Sphaerobolus stellatus SS14]|uniref:rRNA-processing protein n=1 Tax=Sphaerobolus stellatus (strain SS14) TaxID=990650 RepID=A0A0C9W0Z7_SPHS4|nr:hypothetical protein M422DRAFT_251338 [Sphaerobolus stellatus SS14]